MKKEKAFKVPYGLDVGGELVKAPDALKTNQYSCPSCGTFLVLRKGEVRAPHFAHKVVANCSEETVAHKTAKMFIINAVTQWRRGQGSQPKIKRLCKQPRCDVYVEQLLPDRVLRAVEELRLPNGRIADIALVGFIALFLYLIGLYGILYARRKYHVANQDLAALGAAIPWRRACAGGRRCRCRYNLY